MKTNLSCVPFLLVASLLLPACGSMHGDGCSKAQASVDLVAAKHPEVTRLTLHCKPANGSGAIACASTDDGRIGTASDPEDLKVMQTGQPVVLDEAGAIDVTVPCMANGGKCSVACGVTLKSAGMTREQAVTKATAIAEEVEAGLGSCCADGSCCK